MRTITLAITLTTWLGLSTKMAVAQEPAYAPGTGPSVLIDAAHHNALTAFAGHRASIAKWLQGDGYVVRELLHGRFDREALDGVQIAIISNAKSEQNAYRFYPPTEAELAEVWRLPTPSAFSQEEIAFLHEWVVMGGALLLVFDHMPLPGAAEELAAAFGIDISTGFAVDGRSLQGFDGPSVAQAARMVFRRVDGTLAEHPVTNGRGLAERVDSVALYVGSAFRLPPEGRSLLTLGSLFVSLLPDVAWEFSEATPRQNIGGWSQGGVLRVGRGRLAVFGETGILVTPDMVANPAKAGRNPQLQNPQLLLNVLHWLSGLLDER